MVRSTLKESVPLGALALVPFLLAQWSVLAVVLVAPQLVYVGEKPEDRIRTPAMPLSPDDLDERLREMIPVPPGRVRSGPTAVTSLRRGRLDRPCPAP
jgi:hypothetical protein